MNTLEMSHKNYHKYW